MAKNLLGLIHKLTKPEVRMLAYLYKKGWKTKDFVIPDDPDIRILSLKDASELKNLYAARKASYGINEGWDKVLIDLLFKVDEHLNKN